MKILAIEALPSSKRGGSEKAFFEVLTQLKKNGHDVQLAYCFEEDLLQHYQENGIRVIKILSTNIQKWFSLRSYSNLWLSAKEIISCKPDIIYINYLSDTPLAALVKILSGINNVCHIRVPYTGKSRQFAVAAKLTGAFIVLNKGMKLEYQKILDSKRVHIVNDSITIPANTPSAKKQKKALYLGRISPEKGLKELLETWTILRDDYQINFPLDIIGPAHSQIEKAYKDDLSVILTKQKLNHISIKEPVYNAIEVLAGYQFSVFPSIWNEPFGRVVPESILAGTPVFSRKVGVTPQLLKPHESELIYETEAELAKKIFDFMSGTISVNMEALKKHIINTCSIEVNIKAIERLLVENSR